MLIYITKSDAKPVMRDQPEHPDANEQGYVAYPVLIPLLKW